MQKKRAAGSTTVVKGSAGALNSGPRARKQRLQGEEADDSGTLFEALSSGGISIASCMSDWKGRLTHDRDSAIVELVNLVVRASGSTVKLTVADLSSGRDDTNYSRGRLDALLSDGEHVAFDVPLLSKKKQFKDFQKNYDAMWRKWFLESFKDDSNMAACSSRIVSEVGEYFKYVLEIMITLSHDGNRSVRYAASKAAYACLHEAALLRKKFVFKNNFESDIVTKWFDRLKQGVFGNRYRDVDAHVRVESINIIGELAFLKLPSESIDVYLKYVVWFLDDKDTNVRTACVSVLKKIVGRERTVEFEEFLDLHKDKIISQSLFDEDDKICKMLSSSVLPMLISKYGLDEESFSMMAPLLCRPQADVAVVMSMIEVFIDITFNDADFTAIDSKEFFMKLSGWLVESCRSFMQRRNEAFGAQRTVEVSEFVPTMFIATHNVFTALLNKDHWDSRTQIVMNNAHTSLFELLNDESETLDQWHMNSISCMLFSAVKQQIYPDSADSSLIMFAVKPGTDGASLLNSDFYDAFIQVSSQHLLSTLSRFKYMNNDSATSIEMQTYINILNLCVFALVGCVQEGETIDASQRWIGLREYHSFEEILSYLKDMIMETTSATISSCVCKVMFGEWSAGDSSISLLANTSVARKSAVNALGQNFNAIVAKLQSKEQELLNLTRLHSLCEFAAKEVRGYIEKSGLDMSSLVEELVLSLENGNEAIPKTVTVWRILFNLYAYEVSSEETGRDEYHELLLRITALTKTILQMANYEIELWISGGDNNSYSKILEELNELPILEKLLSERIDFMSLVSDSCFLLMSKSLNEDEMSVIMDALTSCNKFMTFTFDSIFSCVLHSVDQPHVAIDSDAARNEIDERECAFLGLLYGDDAKPGITSLNYPSILRASSWSDSVRNIMLALARNTWVILRYDFGNIAGIESVASIASSIGKWNKWMDTYSELVVTEFFSALAKLDQAASSSVAAQFLLNYYKKVHFNISFTFRFVHLLLFYLDTAEQVPCN